MRLPNIKSVRTEIVTRLFRIETVELEFSNGIQRQYERLPPTGEPAVIVVALDSGRDLILVREYAAGFHDFQLSLPKGTAFPGESLGHAAARELSEETGFGARNVEFVKNLRLAPGHMGFTINVMFATDLYPNQLQGGEPEPPEVVTWPVTDLDQLLVSDEFNEARAIAALSLCKERLLSV